MAVLAFQKPEQVVMHRAKSNQGVFEFSPLEKGYGVTIGNSLRRILLSSLEGYAITSIKIEGVDHEFMGIKGVMEDVTELILNLKEVRFKALGDEEFEKITLKISGKDRFIAGDITNSSAYFKVLNPEKTLCHLEPDIDLEIEITVNRGRGYVANTENKPEDAPIGLIPIDSIYSPIRKVRYNVENIRVGQATDFEKLVIELQTDGSMSPEDALKDAAQILIQHYVLFSDQNIAISEDKTKVEEKEDTDDYRRMRKLLQTSLSEMDLSVRAYNCLRAAHINTIGDLVQYEVNELLRFRNFGKKSLTELEELVRDKNLVFGMDLSKYDVTPS